MQLTLLIPELIWPEPDDCDTLDALVCRALSTLIARSHYTRRAPQSLEATLTDAFGLPEGAPYAAFRLLGEPTLSTNSGSDAAWICADPVHLRFHQERLILADSTHFGIELDEAHAICDTFNSQFSDLGKFHVAAAERWYLQSVNANDVGNFDVPPLSVIAGRRVDRQLPATSQTLWLRKLLNEAQMVLHDHPVNVARENAGRMPINSLWFWGAGHLPPCTEGHFDGVWSTYPLAVGLGRAAGVPSHAVPPYAAALFANITSGSRHLILLEDLLGAVQYQNSDAYRRGLHTLETRWFEPLRQALASGKLKQLRLETSTAYGTLSWKSNPVDQWKLWRRTQSLSSLAQNLAKATS
jgi:hypothetical protein